MGCDTAALNTVQFSKDIQLTHLPPGFAKAGMLT